MIDYALKRFGRFLVSLVAMLTMIFLVFRILPGDPTTQLLRADIDEEGRQKILENFGLDAPLHEQYLDFMSDALVGDFGISYSTQEPVASMLLPRLYNTLVIILPAILVIITSAYLLGTRVGWERGRRLDKASSYFQLTFRAVPHFVFGVLLLIVFAYTLGWFPLGRMHPVGEAPTGIVDYIIVTAYHGFLPFLVFTMHYMNDAFLLMRGNIIDQRDKDYVEFLRLKGLPDNDVRHHAAQNSLLPLVTYLPTLILIGIGGQILIEVVFTWPGLGELLVRSVSQRDFAVAQGAFFMIGFLVILGNFLVDLAIGFLDPRIKQG
jgi:peptide/nickel transport system permease protein